MELLVKKGKNRVSYPKLHNNLHVTKLNFNLSKLENKLPETVQVAFISGFSPHGNQLTAELIRRLHGEFDQLNALHPKEFYKNGINGVTIYWDNKSRGGMHSQIDLLNISAENNLNNFNKKIVKLPDSFIKYYYSELLAADIFSGSKESAVIFEILFNYFLSYKEIDTIMAHSTGAKVILSFLDIIFTYRDMIKGLQLDHKQIPWVIVDFLDKMTNNYFDIEVFTSNLLNRIKLIQLIRPNATFEDLSGINRNLLKALNDYNIKIINYYHPEDWILLVAQALTNELQKISKKKSNIFSKLIGLNPLTGLESIVTNVKLHNGGINGHNRILEGEPFKEILENRDVVLKFRGKKFNELPPKI
jgi:hypothetical protein